MVKPTDDGLLLGKYTPVVDAYSPQLLYPIPRAPSREAIGLRESQEMRGVDIWHAYELSWLDVAGKPVVAVGRFTVPATSANIVESKSLKLYLNSLNSTSFASSAQAQATIVKDVSAAAGERVGLELFAVDDPAVAGMSLPGDCLDALDATMLPGPPAADMLSVKQEGEIVERTYYSHLLRSLCPVTGQPDWATVWIEYQGAEIVPVSLLQYIVSFRNHQEFHEQCVERMFCDILTGCKPFSMTLQAFYTRRGGLDINPFRSTQSQCQPLGRLDRQ